MFCNDWYFCFWSQSPYISLFFGSRADGWDLFIFLSNAIFSNLTMDMIVKYCFVSLVNVCHWSNFRKKSNFGKNLGKFWKVSILVKFSKNYDCGEIFRKISILVKFSKNFKFGQILEKLRFYSHFPKKVRLLSKFSKNLDFFGNS